MAIFVLGRWEDLPASMEAASFWLRSQDLLYHHLMVIPGSLIISIMGLFWVWQRVSL